MKNDTILNIAKESFIRLPIKQLIPLNSESFLLILRINVAIKLFNIKDVNNKKFNIDKFIEKHNDLFLCENESIKDRIRSFNNIMDSRLERFFLADKDVVVPRSGNKKDKIRKSPYLFFDLEEQEILKKFFEQNPCNCSCEFYIRNMDGEFKLKEYDEILKNKKKNNLINKALLLNPTVKIIASMSLNKYQFLKTIELKAKERSKVEKEKQEMIKLENIFKYFPELNAKNECEFKKSVKSLRFKLHPDTRNKNETRDFAKLVNSIKFIKRTMWYRKMKGGDVD